MYASTYIKVKLEKILEHTNMLKYISKSATEITYC